MGEEENSEKGITTKRAKITKKGRERTGRFFFVSEFLGVFGELGGSFCSFFCFSPALSVVSLD